jgi:hypothetical protein
MTDGELGIERRLSVAGSWRKSVDGVETNASDLISKLSSRRVAIAATLISSSSRCYHCRRGRRSLWRDIDLGLKSREIKGFAAL